LIAPISFGALAQSDDEAEASVIEEIIVLSDRREKNIMEVTQSIQAIPEEQLQLPTFNDLSDITMLIPGATHFGNKPPYDQNIQLRASGIVQSGSSDGQAPVGYYVDDVPFVDISTPVPPPIGTYDLQRIEVLRGPQGTSYGQDSQAGSVILRTNPVDLENLGFKAQVGISDIDGTSGTGYSVGGVVNLPLVKDVFGIRISYLQEQNPGYGYVEGEPDYDDPLAYSRDSVRIKALWHIAEWFDLELTHSEWNTEYHNLIGNQILDTTGGEMILSPVTVDILLDVFPGGRVKNDFEINWSTLLLRFDLGFAALTSSTGLVDTPKKEANSEYIFDIGLGPQKSGVISNQPAETFTQEFRLVSTTDSNLQWLAGLFYMDVESNSENFSEIPDFFIYVHENNQIQSETFAVYGEIEYAFNDQWSFTAGLRYQDVDRTDTSVSDLGFIGVDPPFGPYSLPGEETVVDNTYDATSYRLGLTWTPSENGMIYLTHSQTYRAPIILGQASLDALEAAGIDAQSNLDPAELNNTEIGIKWTVAERLQVDAAYIYADWKDIPLWADVNIPPQPVAMAISGTDGLVTSFEIGLNWAVSDNWALNYAGAFVDTEVKNVPPPGAVDNYPSAVKLGGKLYNYSPTTHNFGINYNQAIGGGDWSIFGSLNYVIRDKVDGINVFTAPDEYVPSADDFENLAATIGAAVGRWNFSLSAGNLTDHSGQYLPRTALGGTDAQLFGLIQQPRTVTFQVRWDGM